MNHLADCEVRQKINFPTIDDLRKFLNNNDAGVSDEDHLRGCEKLLKKYERAENYEYCALILEYINFKRGKS